MQNTHSADVRRGNGETLVVRIVAAPVSTREQKHFMFNLFAHELKLFRECKCLLNILQ